MKQGSCTCPKDRRRFSQRRPATYWWEGGGFLGGELGNHCQLLSSAFTTEVKSQRMLIQQQLMNNWLVPLEQAGEGTLQYLNGLKSLRFDESHLRALKETA